MENIKKEVFRCKKCNSTNVLIKQWVNPNTDEMFTDNSDLDLKNCWCLDCESNTTLKICKK